MGDREWPRLDAPLANVSFLPRGELAQQSQRRLVGDRVQLPQLDAHGGDGRTAEIRAASLDDEEDDFVDEDENAPPEPDEEVDDI